MQRFGLTGLDSATREASLATLRTYCERELSHSVVAQFDADNELPRRIIRDLMHPEHLGIGAMMFPAKYGGFAGNSFDLYCICEILARFDLSICTSVLGTFLGACPILVGGDDSQKDRWLSAIVREGWLVAYCATEPTGGSDLMRLHTRAEPIIANQQTVGYQISGAKAWITNGGAADLYSVLAQTPTGPSWFVMQGSETGLIRHPSEDKHGIRASNTCPLSFDGVRISADTAPAISYWISI